MEIDTTRTVRIQASPMRVLQPILLGMVMSCVCIAVVVIYFGTGDTREYMGWAGTVLFGALTVGSIWRSSQVGQAVLTLSPEGFRDIRIGPEFIPWSAVETIFVRENNPGRGVIVKSIGVKVLESIRQDSRFGRSGHWSQVAGAHGLSIETAQLAPNFDDMLAMIEAYKAAYGRNVAS